MDSWNACRMLEYCFIGLFVIGLFFVDMWTRDYLLNMMITFILIAIYIQGLDLRRIHK